MTRPRKRTYSAVELTQLRNDLIEDWLVNCLECLLDGDAIGQRERGILQRACRRALSAAVITEAYRDQQGKVKP